MSSQKETSKIVVSTAEVESVSLPADPLDSAKAAPAICWWTRVLFLPFILVQPLLAIVALVMRIALRGTPPRTQKAWQTYLLTLLIASSLLSTVAAVVLFSYMPAPPQAISNGLSELDERSDFPALPNETVMSGREIGRELRPLVMVASPAAKRWFSRGEMVSNRIGAAVLLYVNENGYLFATAGHVAGAPSSATKPVQRVLLTTGIGGWAGADVVGWHRTADLALLWLPRHFGHATFAQPLQGADDSLAGENIYVIGHPEGLDFTISNGIISRTQGDTVQISAPVSPGDSGGPVYDEHGNLVGVVTAKIDRTVAPNAENLSFAASASLLRRLSGWEFVAEGRQRLSEYIDAVRAEQKTETER